MKKLVHRINEEILRRDFPITGEVEGWFFRQKEVSNGAWVVDGTDCWGRQVMRTGDDPDQLLIECAALAKAINEQIK